MSASGRLPLKNLFSKFDITPNRKTAEQIIRWKLMYETRDTHPDALNTPLLGCAKIGFFNKDTNALFDILGVDKDEFKNAIKTSSVDPNYHVASDEFNLLTVYAAHKYFTSSLPQKLREDVTKALFFMMLVKFFSSIMRHYLPYGATNPGAMEATIDALSDKFDIKHKETSTWKLMMEVRAEEMITPNNIHWNALHNFTPDAKVVYIITDLQTRLRSKVQLVIAEYFEMMHNEREIRDTTLVGTDLDGKTTIKELTNSFESMVASICNRVLNTQQFIRSDYIKICSKLVPNVREDLMRNMLMAFSSSATIQYQKKKGDSMSKDGKYYAGYHILIQNLIQSSYRDCIMKKVNMNSRYEILKNTLNMFRSSRIVDANVLKLKESVENVVIGKKFSSRDATNASLKIAFIAYIILMSFDCD